MSSSLVIDFHGPIAFRFSDKNGTDGEGVRAYIPICDYHIGNVLTDKNDISPEERKTFRLKGPDPATQTEAPQGNRFTPLVLVDWQKETEKKRPTEQQCYATFILPLPDYIYGLRPEPVEITRPNGTPIKKNYARGHRFYYTKCMTAPTIKPTTSSKTTFEDLDARCFQPDLTYRIEIRYHDINPLQPRPHRDADLCSESLRKLFPPLQKWTVKFEDPTIAEEVRKAVVGPHGVDCEAHGLVLNDGGLKIT